MQKKNSLLLKIIERSLKKNELNKTNKIPIESFDLIVNRLCAFCNKKMTSPKRKQKYCSDLCVAKERYRRKKTQLEVK